MYPFSRHSLCVKHISNSRLYPVYDATTRKSPASHGHLPGYVIGERTPGLLRRLALLVICFGILAAPLYWVAAPIVSDLGQQARLQQTPGGPSSHKANRLPWPPQPDGRMALHEGTKHKSSGRRSDRLIVPIVEYGRKQAQQLTALIKKLSPLPYIQKILKRDTAKTRLVALKSSPFPYTGVMPKSQKPFLNIKDGNRRGHKTAFGRSYWGNETYNDSRALLHIPKKFNIRAPGVMVVFFHGHGAKLERDILKRQRVPAQISQSGMNAVLVAPQFAVDARDSSAGKFWKPGALRRFLDEASAKLAKLQGDPKSERVFKNMPVVIIAYSGGFVPAAYSVAHGGLHSRLRGVVLLDGLYGHLDKFANWIKQARSGFFLSAYAGSTKRRNEKLKKILSQKKIAFTTKLKPELGFGSVTFLATDARHRDFVTLAWAVNPISDLLIRIGRITGQVPLRVSSLDQN